MSKTQEWDEADADFDHVAERQGWNNDSMLGIVRSFVSQEGLSDALGEFAVGVAAEENEATALAD